MDRLRRHIPDCDRSGRHGKELSCQSHPQRATYHREFTDRCFFVTFDDLGPSPITFQSSWAQSWLVLTLCTIFPCFSVPPAPELSLLRHFVDLQRSGKYRQPLLRSWISQASESF